MTTEQLTPAEPAQPVRVTIELDQATIDRIQKYHDDGDEFTDTPLQEWQDEGDALGDLVLFEVMLQLGRLGRVK